jgi:hypothetical protein
MKNEKSKSSLLDIFQKLNTADKMNKEINSIVSKGKLQLGKVGRLRRTIQRDIKKRNLQQFQGL